MQKTRFSRTVSGATAVLVGTLLYAGHASEAAKPKPVAATASVAQGKALTAKYRCTGCHNAQLQGRPGFSPSIRLTGAMHDYTKAQFVTLMHTGMKNDGGHVRKPMPVYAAMPAGEATSIFAYLHTLK